MKTPLTQTQLAIYYESVTKADLPAYIVPLMINLEQDADLNRLQLSVDKVMERYPVLSMVLEKGEDGMPYLTEDGHLQKCRLEELTDEAFEKLHAQLPRPFTLEGGKLAETVIYKTPSQTYLYLAFHHVIVDGSTLGIIIRTIADIYDDRELNPVPMSIFEVQAKEETLRNSPRFEEARKWYGDTFGSIETDSMPLSDILEENAATDNGSILSTLKRKSLPLSVNYDDVFKSSREWKVPLSVVLDGAFGYLAGVWNAAEESLFTTIFAGRSTEEEKQVAGMMVKTLPVYCKWDKDTTVTDYLNTIAIQHKKAKDYADTYSFAEVCSDTGMHPQLNFSYRGSIQVENIVIPGIFNGSSRLGNYTTGDTLQFLLDHIDGHLVLKAEYQGSRYTDAFIESLLDTYDVVLKGFLCKEKLSEIEFCSEAMTAKLEALNQTVENKETAGLTIVDLFRRHVQQTPDKVLLKNDDAEFTYRQVADRADTLAAHIHSLGIGKGDVVAVLVDRNEWMLTATMGVLCSGAGYQPLDATYPAERLNYMMRDAGVRLLVADRHIALTLEDDLKEKIQILYTDEIAVLPVVAEDDDLKPAPEDTFILLYTSGTTGLPKGVTLTHSNLMSIWEVNHRSLPAVTGPEDTWAVYASYGFDAGFYSILMPVCAGASVSIVPEDIRLDMEGLNEFLCRHEVTFTIMTTQVGRIFCTSIEKTSLKAMMVGGEKLVPCAPPEDFDLYNGYGPTEGTVYCNAKKVDKLYTRVPIGRMNDDYKGYIVNKYGKHMPLGALGELLISGPQVGAGYLNLPEKTAAAFKPNPFCNEKPFDRLYCTGDIVRFLPESGEADIIGRNDGQVKIRGFRIELAEVESVIREFAGIKDATVQAFDDPAGGKFIAAYVVSDSPVDINALNAFIGERKPPYMIPAVTMQIDAIPLNQNQKVNKRALPEPKLAATEQSATSQQSERKPDRLEQQIADIITEILGMKDVPFETPLSLLGLTSISSIRLSSKLYKCFGINIKGADLVSGASLATVNDAVLDKLLHQETAGVGNSAADISTAPNTPVALSAPQLGVYLDWEMNRDSLQYNIPTVLHFGKNIDCDRLVNALKDVINAHPALKTHLTKDEGEVRQRIYDEEAAVTLHRLDHEPDADFFIGRIKPFDLFNDRLYRIEVYTTPESVYLFRDIHHIVFDGMSLVVFDRDLAKAYDGETLTTESYSILDYASEQANLQDTPFWQQAETHYIDLLDSAENVAWPHIFDDEKPWNGDEQHSMCTASQAFDAPEVDAFCKTNNVTANSYFMTCMMEVMHSVTREEKIVSTAIHHGREDMRLLGNIGMYVTTLPIVSNRKEHLPFIDNVRQMQEHFTATVANAAYPFATIAEKWGIKPYILYAYQDMAGLASMDGSGQSFSSRGEEVVLESARNTVKTPIEFSVIKKAEGAYELQLNYDAARYSHRDMETFIGMVINFAKSSAVGQGTMISAKEQQRIMTVSQGKHLDYDTAETWVDLFVRQAAATPDAIALADGDTSLTYGELDSRSNALAHILIERSVMPDSFVCLRLKRTVRFPLAVLSIHKAAAAYVPVDPEYPEERQQYMIENSETKVVLDDTFFDDFEKQFAEGNTINEPINLTTPDNLAYMIYTSGSTGKPKGAMLHQAGLRNFIEVVKDMEKLTAADRISGHRSFSFDAHIEDMYPVLTLGGSFHIMPSEIRKNLTDIRQFILDHKITGGGYATAITCLLLNAYSDLPLRFITGGGEKMDGISSDHVEIINVYGPTECTDDTSYFAIKPGEKVQNIPIGQSVANNWNFIVDPQGRLVPQGVAGELCFAGIQVGRGYWRLPERTAQSFGDCPFVSEDAFGRKVRMYHTGDLARWNDDGQIEFLGRIDFQVKLRGFRIELGEIESKALAIDGVSQALALVEKIDGDDHLIIYYVGDMDEAALISTLSKSSLTDYMIPEIAIRMDKMPLTPNGKVNRKELPRPVMAHRTDGRLPQTELERFFAEAFANALGRNKEEIFADDNFFKIGGTSLAVMRVIVAAAAAGHQIIYKDVFDNPTPESLAALLGEKPSTQSMDSKADEPANTGSFMVGPDNYDYTTINTLLSGNTLDAFRSGKRRELGTVLLTGATGFAGMHVLHELLSEYDVPVVCLGRDSHAGVSADERIEQLYFYYFDESMSDRYPGRVTVIKSDITKIDKDFDPGTKIDTVINCAANVKHFSAGTDIEDINYHGVLNLIEWCKGHGAALVQTSTISVTGRQPAERNNILTEQSLFIGQDLAGNKYITSKFMAERAVLEAHARGEIAGKVIRLGNLAPRERDGEFQINFSTNGFMNRLKSITLVGCYPYAMYSQSMDISPIDDVARAIVLFAQTPDACVMFHGNNANRYLLGNFYHEVSLANIDIHPVETDRFAAALDEAKSDPGKLNALVGLMAYEGIGAGLKPVEYSNDYSSQVLLRMGFHWPVISTKYIEKLVRQLDGLGFFNMS